MKNEAKKETLSKKQKFSLQMRRTLDKVKAFPSTSLPAGQPNPNTLRLSSSLLSPSAPSEESPMKKFKSSEDSSKKVKINLVKVAGEDLCHVDEELSPAAQEVDEEDWEEGGDEE